MFGLLGPNGAGKTTTVEILEGYRQRDGGARDGARRRPRARGRELARTRSASCSSRRRCTRISPSASGSRCSPATTAPRDVDDVIDARRPRREARRRVKRSRAASSVGSTSALGIDRRPEILFLDEPTTGFDPAARRAAWEMIRSLRELGKTILLTTHYLDEAEQLADRVAVLREGRIVAIGNAARADGGAARRDPLPRERPRGRRRRPTSRRGRCTS